MLGKSWSQLEARTYPRHNPNTKSTLRPPHTFLFHKLDMMLHPVNFAASRFQHCMLGRPDYVACTLYRTFQSSSSETFQRGSWYSSLQPLESFQRGTCVNTRQRLQLQTILRHRANKTTPTQVTTTKRVKTSIRYKSYKRIDHYLKAT